MKIFSVGYLGRGTWGDNIRVRISSYGTGDKENSYNLNTTIDTIIEDIVSDKSGLIIFNSNPGAGKSSLIKYLAQELQDKVFFFLNNNNIHILSNPEFTTYCLSNLKNCVLVLEDVDLYNLVVKRSTRLKQLFHQIRK